MEKITPKVDIAFKKIFGVEENKDLLISLINSIVSEADQVADVTLLNPYNLQSFKNDKLSILDVKAKGVDGKLFNIEIQISDEADYDKRALYYWAELYTNQISAGEDYSILNKAIGIHILNFVSITENDKYHNIFQITEKETGQPYFTDLELHTIELKKFLPNSGKADLNELVGRAKNALDVWLAFLTRHDLLNKDNLPVEFTNQPVEKALNVIGIMNFTKEEREAYHERLKWLRIEANTLEKRYQQGIEQGIEQGANKKSLEIAKNMLKEKFDLEIISSVTGLSKSQILKLKD